MGAQNRTWVIIPLLLLHARAQAACSDDGEGALSTASLLQARHTTRRQILTLDGDVELEEATTTPEADVVAGGKASREALASGEAVHEGTSSEALLQTWPLWKTWPLWAQVLSAIVPVVAASAAAVSAFVAVDAGKTRTQALSTAKIKTFVAATSGSLDCALNFDPEFDYAVKKMAHAHAANGPESCQEYAEELGTGRPAYAEEPESALGCQKPADEEETGREESAQKGLKEIEADRDEKAEHETCNYLRPEAFAIFPDLA